MKRSDDKPIRGGGVFSVRWRVCSAIRGNIRLCGGKTSLGFRICYNKLK